MAVDVSKGAFELFSGRKRTRLLPTLVIAVVATAAVAVPLVVRAVNATDETAEQPTVAAPADSQAVIVDTVSEDPQPLDQSIVSGPILISIRQPDASAVSFNLFAAGADQAVVESLDVEGPQFDLVVTESGVSPFDSTLLSNGPYELFITVRAPGEDRRTAVSFQVQNP